ncbi:MAG: DMT family transporter [Spirochaetaceae bacterium]|nr:DMT family transporter [Spirochaetaceae bacterium]
MKNKNWLLVVLIAAWSAFFILNKLLMQELNSAFVSSFFLRSLTMLLLIVFFTSTKRFKLLGQVKKSWLPMLIVAIAVFGFDIIGNIGFLYSDVGTGTVLLKSEIIFVCIISAVIFKEKHRYYEWILVGVMLAGVVLTLDINYADFKFNVYSLLFVLSGLINAGCAFAIKYMQKKCQLDSYVIVFFNNLVAMIAFGVCSLITGDMMNINYSGLNFVLFFPVFIFGSFMQIAQMLTYYKSIELFPVWKVKTLVLLVPVICAVLSVRVFSEKHTALGYVGMAIVILGAICLGIIDRKKKYQPLNNAVPSKNARIRLKTMRYD